MFFTFEIRNFCYSYRLQNSRKTRSTYDEASPIFFLHFTLSHSSYFISNALFRPPKHDCQDEKCHEKFKKWKRSAMLFINFSWYSTSPRLHHRSNRIINRRSWLSKRDEQCSTFDKRREGREKKLISMKRHPVFDCAADSIRRRRQFCLI